MSDFLICYDITDPRRLQRLHRRISHHALRVQYSVYLYSGDVRCLARLLREWAALIDDKTDDLRCYPLPAHGQRLRLGRPVLPEGIIVSDLPTGVF